MKKLLLTTDIDFSEAGIEDALATFPKEHRYKELTVSVFDAVKAVEMLVRVDGSYRTIRKVHVVQTMATGQWKLEEVDPITPYGESYFMEGGL